MTDSETILSEDQKLLREIKALTAELKKGLDGSKAVAIRVKRDTLTKVIAVLDGPATSAISRAELKQRLKPKEL